jgi:DsbC/DsbD-like thiol-disulfide interchange protein
MVAGAISTDMTSPATAQDASRWDGDARSAVRLVAGSVADKHAPLRAGIEIRLKAGWHTYWRYPGDAGVPPRIDFTGSRNVRSVAVGWPAPQRIEEDGGLAVIGYTGGVTLPLTIVPERRGEPVTLRLALDYAICEKLCVPAEARLELVLGTARSSPQDGALATAQARVPKPAALGASTPVAIMSVQRDTASGRARLLVDVAAPAGTRPALFAEGPTPNWALPVPSAIDGAPSGQQRFAFDLDGAPPGASFADVTLTLTAVAAGEAIETVARLD